ncbi:unnamed protein product, partial [marine sediment metagenome]
DASHISFCDREQLSRRDGASCERFVVEPPEWETEMNPRKQNGAQQQDQGIVRDDMGQEQPKDKERARNVSRQASKDDPPGHKPAGERRDP